MNHLTKSIQVETSFLDFENFHLQICNKRRTVLRDFFGFTAETTGTDTRALIIFFSGGGRRAFTRNRRSNGIRRRRSNDVVMRVRWWIRFIKLRFLVRWDACTWSFFFKLSLSLAHRSLFWILCALYFSLCFFLFLVSLLNKAEEILVGKEREEMERNESLAVDYFNGWDFISFASGRRLLLYNGAVTEFRFFLLTQTPLGYPNAFSFFLPFLASFQNNSKRNHFH